MGNPPHSHLPARHPSFKLFPKVSPLFLFYAFMDGRTTGCRNISEYEIIKPIGSGTYGIVLLAKDKTYNELVALKQVRIDDKTVFRDGMPITALREIKFLMSFNHSNIVKLLDISIGNSLTDIYLVLEFIDHDLAKLMDRFRNNPFFLPEIKTIFRDLLLAVEALHSRNILHRDIKMSNLLYSRNGQIKLCDFGLSRQLSLPSNTLTPNVVTLWYRAPELLLGSEDYTTAIDIFACGAVFAELLLHRPLFPANTEAELAAFFSDNLGVPDESCSEILQLMKSSEVKILPPKESRSTKKLYSKVSTFSKNCKDLLFSMLQYEPSKRPSAADLLQHPFFYEDPLPRPHHSMPKFDSQFDLLRESMVKVLRSAPSVTNRKRTWLDAVNSLISMEPRIKKSKP
ncbi:hypothetical protein RCL1_006816 [Eukaryota sp. TZLM3-RCL]